MSFLPVQISLENKKILLIGGGKIAFRRLQYLLEFTKNIEIISLEFSQKIEGLIKKNSLKYEKKAFENESINSFDIVVCAVDDLKLQEKLFEKSREFRVLYNCVDFPSFCDFTFPSYIKKGDLTISISTQGNSPAISKYLRIYLESKIPNSITQFLEDMKAYRKSMPKGSSRMKLLEQKAKEYFDNIKKV